MFIFLSKLTNYSLTQLFFFFFFFFFFFVTSILLNVYAMRMAAVFTLTTVTIARRTEIVRRWLTVAGLLSALVLLIGVGLSPWVELLFPAWILALSIDILAAGLKASSAGTPGAARA